MGTALPGLPESGNYVLGAGKVLFRQSGEAGFRYLVTTPDFTITADTEVAELYGADTPVAQKIGSTETQRDYTGTFAVHDINLDNLAYFFGGEVEVEEQDAGTVVEEEFTVVQGGVYRIGVDNDHPLGVRQISSVVVDDGDTTTYDEGDDYVIDERRGLINILPGGAIDDGDTIEVSCAYAEVDISRTLSTGAKTIRGEVYFVAGNSDGENTDVIIRNVILRADGEWALKSRDDYQGLGFSMEISSDERGNLLYIEGELPDPV